MMILTVQSEDGIWDAVPAALKAQFGVDSFKQLADHIIYCRPPSVPGSSVFSSGLVSMLDSRY
jgi:hypothetical protein